MKAETNDLQTAAAGALAVSGEFVDLDGERTPMQWYPDRNGGISRARTRIDSLAQHIDQFHNFGNRNVELKRLN